MLYTSEYVYPYTQLDIQCCMCMYMHEYMNYCMTIRTQYTYYIR